MSDLPVDIAWLVLQHFEPNGIAPLSKKSFADVFLFRMGTGDFG